MTYRFMFFRRLISTLLFLEVLVPLVITVPSVAQSKLDDVQGSWNQKCIESLSQRDIISGYPDGSFRPNSPITRAEFAAIIDKAFPNAAATRKPLQFTDVPASYWAYDAIREASQTRFLSGYPGNVFKPNQNIPRVQVLVALTSGLNYSPTKIVPTVLNATFEDATRIPNYARSGIAAATERRLVVNYPNVRSLRPNELANRAEVASFLCQALAGSNQASLVPSQYIAGIPGNQASQIPAGNTSDKFYPLNQQDVKSWTGVSFGMSASALKERFGNKLTLSPVSDSSCLSSGGLNCKGTTQWILNNFNINKRPYDVTFQLDDDKLSTVSIQKYSDASNDFVRFKELLQKQYGPPTITDTELSKIGLTRYIWRIPSTDIYLNQIERNGNTSMGLFYLSKNSSN